MEPFKVPPMSFDAGQMLESRESARQTVLVPATALMVVAGCCIATMMVVLPFEAYLILSGAARRLNPHIYPMNMIVRVAWSLVLLGASGYTLWGALQMRNLRSLTHARLAAIIATIPCIGPCYILGIPFGIWALVLLSRVEIAGQFER
jgi:hypothetical protein